MNILSKAKPWGNSLTLTQNENSTVKLLTVKKGEALSLQYHQNREEFWKILKGNPELVIGEKTIEAHPDEEYSVLRTIKHRISAPTDDVLILEISKGTFDENDIVRLKDKYGR